MGPIKKQSNVGAGFAAIGVVLAAAIGVFASTFNPPAQPVITDTVSTTTPTTPITTTPIETPIIPAAFGSVFPAPATTTAVTTTKTTPPAPVTKPAPTPPPAPVTTSVYTDGTYSATGSYNSPGGEDRVAVTLTLNNDIVTSVTATPETQDRTSARYQTMFVSGYKQYVVGKNIADIHVGKVSGSSLTSIGFNAAITKIEAEAKA